MSGVNRVVPAKVRASPTKPGAEPLCQLGLLLQLLSAPPPFQTSEAVVMVTVKPGVVVESGVGLLLSVMVAVSVLTPVVIPGPTTTVLVKLLPPAVSSGTLSEPPSAVASTITLLTGVALNDTATVINTP